MRKFLTALAIVTAIAFLWYFVLPLLELAFAR